MGKEEARRPASGPGPSSDALRRRLCEAAAELRALAEHKPERAWELIDQARRIEALANARMDGAEADAPPLPRDLTR